VTAELWILRAIGVVLVAFSVVLVVALIVAAKGNKPRLR
jgi:hypothetical protein